MPSKIGIQRLIEVFEEAKNKDKLNTADKSQYMILKDEWLSARGNKKNKAEKLKQLQTLYKNVLYNK